MLNIKIKEKNCLATQANKDGFLFLIANEQKGPSNLLSMKLINKTILTNTSKIFNANIPISQGRMYGKSELKTKSHIMHVETKKISRFTEQ